MKYRLLGRTGLKVSEISFGCGPTAGLMIHGTPIEQRIAVARALELGINYFDTAPIYGNGISETNLGRILKELGVKPIIATKIALEMDDLDNITEAVTRSIEASLTRLGVDCIDVVYLHNRVAIKRATKADIGVGAALTVSDILGPGGVLEALDNLKHDQKIRFLGCNAFGGEISCIYQLIESERFDAIIVPYNLLNPTAGMATPPGFRGRDFGQVIDRAAAHNTGVVAIRVLAGGILGGQEQQYPIIRTYQSDREHSSNTTIAQMLRFLLEDSGGTLAQAAIRFALMKTAISTVLVGFSNVAQVEEATAASDMTGFSPQTLARLQELYSINFKFAARTP